MKKVKLSLCVLFLASLLCALTPSVSMAQDDGGFQFPGGPHHITSVEQ
jgi:hypothetical protein